MVASFKFELWTPNKMTCGCSPMANHREYYKGKDGGFPQV